MLHTHTEEYYLVIKKNAILPHVPTWMELKSVRLSEVSQPDQDQYPKFSHTAKRSPRGFNSD